MSRHPHRLTWTKMGRVEIPADTVMGRIDAVRDDRARWHILDDEHRPICEQVPGKRISESKPASQVEGCICDRCHHEFSWSPMPSDTEWRDCGYETHCLVWIRGLKEGYGNRGRQGRWTSTHRAAYAQAKGAIPAGYVVHHLCGHEACLNPDHLEAMSRGDHLRLHRIWRNSSRSQKGLKRSA